MQSVTTYEESLLLTLEEIEHLASHTGDPAETLDNIVRVLGNRFVVDVCSIYLLEPDRATLVLAATVGLSRSGIGTVRMRTEEGLTGLVAERMVPISLAEAKKHPRFKYFPHAGEDAYSSFLGTPLIHGGLLHGVLIIQTEEPREFTEVEQQMLISASRQIGPLVNEARSLEQFVVPAHARLWALARNLWWSWDEDTVSLFRDLDAVRWRELDHNPVALLSEVSLETVARRAGQRVLHGRINYAYRRLQEYLKSDSTWGGTHAGVLGARPVAYFSAEFGIHESLPTYSGGLGVLAGDHIKSASDLGIPLVGVGLFYNQGYFRQRLDTSGWQEEEYLSVDVRELPVEPAVNAEGQLVIIEIETRSSTIKARIWKVAVGRTTLLLLDSDVEGNAPDDRMLTSRLYGGDDRTRIRQELLLGVGGLRALGALGIQPSVMHLNEGHSAFALLEATRQRMSDEGLEFEDALRAVARETVFTTHTPVPAGHDRFNNELVEEHLGPLGDKLGLNHDQLMALGRTDPDNPGEALCMTTLALRHARRSNGVSSLHGTVTRKMWRTLWPERDEAEVPIGHITNGVHAPSWLAPQMHVVYDRHLGPAWAQHSGEPETWDGIERVDDGELWETHIALKSRLIDFVRRRASEQAERRSESSDIVEGLRGALSSDALTIGFARRFATYKRADLILRDRDQLAKLVNNPKWPVQLVFAGKAHPKDEEGKRVLQRIVELTRDDEFFGKIVFVEDYDINVGRHLVQGSDVWLNNPRRPLEASGTSGQKAVLNGCLNLSILDGWWAEAYDGSNGFAIGNGQTHSSLQVQDERDGYNLFETLQSHVVPMYYDRDQDGLSRPWIRRMKRGIRTLGWRFNADRMVMDYVSSAYVPTAGGTSCEMGML